MKAEDSEASKAKRKKREMRERGSARGQRVSEDTCLCFT